MIVVLMKNADAMFVLQSRNLAAASKIFGKVMVRKVR